MLYEIDAFGIKATLVEPGHLRIDEPTGLDDKAADSSLAIKKYGHFLVKPPSAPYDNPTAPAGHARRIVQWLSDRQPTSAVKSAELVWQLGHCKYPPLRLLLGTYAIESVRDRMRSVLEEIEDWNHLHFPTTVEEEARGGRSDNTAGEEKKEDKDEVAKDEDAMDVVEGDDDTMDQGA